MKIALDAGHGLKNGKPLGAHGCGEVEDDLTYRFVDRVGHYLRAKGHSTVLLRPTLNNVLITSRCVKAIANRCKLMVSIHFNAAAPAAYGWEIFVKAGDTRSNNMAKDILDDMCLKFGLRNRGVKPDTASHVGKLGILRGTSSFMPAMLIECGFITSRKDIAWVKDKRMFENYAVALADYINQSIN